MPHFVGAIQAPSYGRGYATPNDLAVLQARQQELAWFDMWQRQQQALNFNGLQDQDRKEQLAFDRKLALLDAEKAWQSDLNYQDFLQRGDLNAQLAGFQEERDRRGMLEGRINQKAAQDYEEQRTNRLFQHQSAMDESRQKAEMDRLKYEQEAKRQDYQDLQRSKLEIMQVQKQADERRVWMQETWKGLKDGSLTLPPKANEELDELDELEYETARDERLDDQGKQSAQQQIFDRRVQILQHARPNRNAKPSFEEQVKSSRFVDENGDVYLPGKNGTPMFSHNIHQPKGGGSYSSSKEAVEQKAQSDRDKRASDAFMNLMKMTKTDPNTGMKTNVHTKESALETIAVLHPESQIAKSVFEQRRKTKAEFDAAVSQRPADAPYPSRSEAEVKATMGNYWQPPNMDAPPAQPQGPAPGAPIGPPAGRPIPTGEAAPYQPPQIDAAKLPHALRPRMVQVGAQLMTPEDAAYVKGGTGEAPTKGWVEDKRRVDRNIQQAKDYISAMKQQPPEVQQALKNAPEFQYYWQILLEAKRLGY